MTTTPDSAEAAIDANNSDDKPNDKPTEENLTFRKAIEEWLTSLRGAIARAADIAALETRLAALSLAQILIIACACGLLLASAWIALLAAITTWLHQLGLSWTSALLLVAAVNFVFACGGGFAIYRLSRGLLFQSTRKILFNQPHSIVEKNHAAAESAAQHTPTAP